jgi:hypothetical protein
MVITNFLGYKHWSPYWVYIIPILTSLVKPFHLDKINFDKNIVKMKLTKYSKGNEKHKQEINITWNKICTLQNTKKESDLDLNTKISKCITNAFFYRLKFRSIDLITNNWVGDHLLTWWQPLFSCLNKTTLLTS